MEIHGFTGAITIHGDMTVGEATNLLLDRLVALEYCVFVCLICGIMMYYNVLCIRMCIYIYTYIRKCDVPPELIWCFPKVLTLCLPHRLQPPLQHQVLMSLSSLDQAEDDEEQLSKMGGAWCC